MLSISTYGRKSLVALTESRAFGNKKDKNCRPINPSLHNELIYSFSDARAYCFVFLLAILEILFSETRI